MEQQGFQILALDGGGMRGLFSAAVLAAVEEDLGTRIADHFDLIAGTSTGGIIAIGLGLGLTPREIVDFYIAHGPSVFSNPLRLRSLQRWVIRKYSSRPLERALRQLFGERPLGCSTKRLVIPSYNLLDDDVYLFRTPHHPSLRRDYRVPAWKVAVATAAAPTFFAATRTVSGLRLIDGGLWANNPAMVALVEATGTLGIPFDRISMLSIGTYDAVVKRPSMLDRGGKLIWASSAVEVLTRAQSIAADNHVRFLVGKGRYVRVDPKVSPGDLTLDRHKDSVELIARAQHHSRRLMPTIADAFLEHRASAYEPIYPAPEEQCE